MPSKQTPTLRAQWLGKLLKDLREQSGHTLREAAEYLRRDASALSRFESGIYPLRRGDVIDLMDLYGVEGELQRTTLLQLVEEISKTGWWDKYTKDVSASTVDYVWLESRAERIRLFSPLVVAGLLQTRDYATEVIKVGDQNASLQQIERWVGLRMTRKHILERADAVKLSAVLDEAVLHRLTGGRKVLADQLNHLLELAHRPNIEIRIVPFREGAYDNPDSAFTLLKMADPFPEVAHADSAAGRIFLETEDVDRLASVYDHLHESCLSADDSIALIAARTKDLS